MRRAITIGTSFVAILALAYLWPLLGGFDGEWQRARSDVRRGHCCCTGRAEAVETAAPKGSQPRVTLDPNQFVGPVKEAYKFAEKNPELLAELHCYCGCDKGGRSSEPARLLSQHAWRVVRNLHRRGVAGEADVGAGLAGRSDSRCNPQEFCARQLKRTRAAICGVEVFNQNRFDVIECRSAAAA